MRYTVVISTYNRARSLAETLAAVARIRTSRSWEVLVVDNPSTDDTEAVVRALAPGYPVELRYVYEPVHGKYAAMNTAVIAPMTSIPYSPARSSRRQTTTPSSIPNGSSPRTARW